MKKYLVIIISVMVLFLGWNMTKVETGEDEYSVIKQMGKIVKVVDEPGLSFKLPIIQSVTKVDKRIQIYDVPASDVITSDKKSMIVDNYVLYQIDDPTKFNQTLTLSFQNAEGKLDALTYNATKTAVSATEQENVIQGREALISAIMNNAGTSSAKYGIAVKQIGIKMLDFPADNKEAVYTRMISDREKIAATYTATGEKNATLIKNETDYEVQVKLAEANATAERLEAEGEAEYMRILSEAYADENKADFYKFVISLDAAKDSLTNKENTLILNSDSPIAEIFY